MLNRGVRLAIAAALCATFTVSMPGVSDARSARPAVFGTTVTVNISGKIAGGINSHYIGLSFESSGLNSGKFDNVGDLARLLENLGSSVMRFGGNSVDTTYAGISPGALAGLVRLAKASGWKVLYSENLGHFDAAAVTADATAVSTALGGSLSAVACGNEPDLYHGNGLRPASYTESDYLAEAAKCLRAIRAGAPNAPLEGPDTAGPKWLPGYAASEAGAIGWLGQHYYPMGCGLQGKTPAQFAAKLLSPGLLVTETAFLTGAATAAKTAHASLRMSETNTACDGGAPGASNSYASALWVVGYLSKYHTNAVLRAGGRPASASVLHLTGPSLLATSGVRIQGASVAASGSFTPGKPDIVHCSSGSCPVTIAPYTAVLVTIG